MDAIKKVTVLHDGGADSISIAQIKWYDKDVMGIRWNVSMREQVDPDKENGKKECLGMPTSTGHPVWFIVPDEFLDRDSDLWREIDLAMRNLDK